jgi:cardiolipin synthase
VLDSDARRERRAIQRALRHTVSRAVHHAFITTPYFVPPRRLRRAMTRAARRGVDVRILTAGLSDMPVVRWAGQHVYDRMLRSGVRIYELFGQALHAKTVTIDGLYSAVGSFNLDRWSDRRNLEVNIAILDPGLAQRLEDRFHQDLERAREIRLEDWTRRAWLVRLLQWLAYQVMRL